MAKTRISRKKLSKTHVDIIEPAQEFIKEAHKLSSVTKITIGRIARIGPGKRNVKFTPIQGGLCVKFRGPASMQDFFIFTKDPVAVQTALSASL